MELINIKKVSAGGTFSLFLTENNELFSCGFNDLNQLGIN
jgi:alpha-tubulin suppressor-like RCC1 family protein